MDPSTLLSPLARRMGRPAATVPSAPIRYNFDQGLAAPETFPTDDLHALMEEVIDEEGPVAFDYYDPVVGSQEMDYGPRGLRLELVRRFAEVDERDVPPDGVIVTSGSVQAIALAAAAYLGPGDGVIVEDLTFRYAIRFFEAAEAHVARVRLDDDGMDLDELEAKLREMSSRGIRPKMIYTVATFHYPTAACLSLERRRRLLEIAQHWGILVVEDNVYGDIRYGGQPIPTIFSLDDVGLVLQSDSFSKKIAPGFRLGWMAGTADAIRPLATVRQDLGVSQFLSRVMTRYLAGGRLAPHLAAANEVYRAKRDLAVSILEKHCAPYVSYRIPDGSFFLWVRLSDGVDWEDVRRRTLESGVLCRPGEMFTDHPESGRFVRMAFSHASFAEIEAGFTIFAEAVQSSVTR